MVAFGQQLNLDRCDYPSFLPAHYRSRSDGESFHAKSEKIGSLEKRCNGANWPYSLWTS